MGFWESIKNIMVIPDEDEIEVENEEAAPARASREKAREEYSYKKESSPRIIKSKTINYSQPQSNLQVVLVKPERFDDEIKNIADHLNEGKTVVLNLEETESDVSRRIVDFLGGVAYANEGNIRKVAKNTFIIVAHGVDFMGEYMSEDFEDGRIYF